MVAKAIVLLAIGALLHPAIALADAAKLPPSHPQERIAQDVKSKMIYYLESDQLHLVAISPEGRIVWTSETSWIRNWHISSFKLSNGALIIDEGDMGRAVFDCKDGSLVVINAL